MLKHLPVYAPFAYKILTQKRWPNKSLDNDHVSIITLVWPVAQKSVGKQEDSPWLFTRHCTNKHLRQLHTSSRKFECFVLLSLLYRHILQETPVSAFFCFQYSQLRCSKSLIWRSLVPESLFFISEHSTCLALLLSGLTTAHWALGKPDMTAAAAVPEKLVFTQHTPGPLATFTCAPSPSSSPSWSPSSS